MTDLSTIELVRDALLEFANTARESNLLSAIMAEELAQQAQALRLSPKRFRADKRAELSQALDAIVNDARTLATAAA